MVDIELKLVGTPYTIIRSIHVTGDADVFTIRYNDSFVGYAESFDDAIERIEDTLATTDLSGVASMSTAEHQRKAIYTLRQRIALVKSDRALLGLHEALNAFDTTLNEVLKREGNDE